MSNRAAIAATGILLGLWCALTFASGPLSPVIAGIAEWVEVALGLDLAVERIEKEDDA